MIPKMSKYILTPFILALLFLPGCKPETTLQEPVKIIFDTDFGPDYDDVGALAFLHAMADSGKGRDIGHACMQPA